jgi:thymidylate kinase
MAPDKAYAPTAAPTAIHRPFLISFSGIDGAGKTTQIDYLSAFLKEQGLCVLRLSFWDDVAVWSKMRAGVGDRSLDSAQAKQTGENSFSPRNNKHVRKWYLSAARAGFYVLDVARLYRLLASEQVSNADVVIFDRYIYDQIANIDSPSFATRSYSKMLLKQAPAPDLAFVIDASPDAAFARKPEYPLEFVHRNRRAFLELQEIVPQLIIISAAISGAGPEEVRSEIIFHISQSRLAERVSTGGKADVSVESAVVRQQSCCSVRNDPTAIV